MNTKYKRTEVLERAEALVLERGFHATGINDILKATGIPSGSFYNFFENKEDFGRSLLENFSRNHLIEPLRELNRARRPAASARLKKYFRDWHQHVRKHKDYSGCLLGNFSKELGGDSGIIQQACAGVFEELSGLVAELIQQAQDEGGVRRDRGAADLADFLLNSWYGALARMKADLDARPLKLALDYAFEAIELQAAD